PWRFVDGESSIARVVAMVEEDRYRALMEKKASCVLTKFGDVAGDRNPGLHEDAAKTRTRPS
ncbi:MAG: cyclase family protein, partial [Candidatus Bipolaricaulota bacterium]